MHLHSEQRACRDQTASRSRCQNTTLRYHVPSRRRPVPADVTGYGGKRRYGPSSMSWVDVADVDALAGRSQTGLWRRWDDRLAGVASRVKAVRHQSRAVAGACNPRDASRMTCAKYAHGLRRGSRALLPIFGVMFLACVLSCSRNKKPGPTMTANDKSRCLAETFASKLALASGATANAGT